MTSLETRIAEDDALRRALEWFSPSQIKKALALIANGGITEREPLADGTTRVWVAKSASRPGITYLVVDDGPSRGTWCNCGVGARGRRCYHQAAAIMLRVHEQHAYCGKGRLGYGYSCRRAPGHPGGHSFTSPTSGTVNVWPAEAADPFDRFKTAAERQAGMTTEEALRRL